MKKLKDIVYLLFSKINRKLKMDKPKFNSLEILLIIIMTTVIGIFIGKVMCTTLKSDKDIGKIQSVYNKLLDEYYNDISEEQLSDAAIDGMTSLLDKYSIHLTDEESEKFQEQLNGYFIGLGVEISLGEDNYPYVVRVLKNTPAEEFGIKDNDKILEINNVLTNNKTLLETSTLIKDASIVNLRIEREGAEITKSIVVGKVNIESVSSKIIEEENSKIGYIKIKIFAQNTDEQFEEHLRSIENEDIANLIIDVRDNSGGYLETAKNIIELFLDKDMPMYQIKDKNGKVETFYSKYSNEKKYKVVLLINRASASASEVLTSALREQYGAITCGQTTYGKGTVQKTMTLKDGSIIKYTAEEWLTSKGATINEKGIESDIKVGSPAEYVIGNPEDNVLNEAIKYLKNN